MSSKMSICFSYFAHTELWKWMWNEVTLCQLRLHFILPAAHISESNNLWPIRHWLRGKSSKENSLQAKRQLFMQSLLERLLFNNLWYGIFNIENLGQGNILERTQRAEGKRCSLLRLLRKFKLSQPEEGGICWFHGLFV